MNKKRLFTNQPKRLFTFGCSFTSWPWATWANILGYELGCEFYNLGKSGAGNHYISSMITQADKVYNFTQNDLVIVCWSSLAREDRYLPGDYWSTPGDIFYQNVYQSEWVKKWAHGAHSQIRDYSLIEFTDCFLKPKTQYHMFSINNLATQFDQYNQHSIENTNLVNLYRDTLDKLPTDMGTVLWSGRIGNKLEQDMKNVYKYYNEVHPSIEQHYTYLKHTFDYMFSIETENMVQETHNQWVIQIQFLYATSKKPKWLAEVADQSNSSIFNKYLIRESDELSSSIIN